MNNIIFALEDRPEGFQPSFETSGVYIEVEGKLLFMQRHPAKPYGLNWGIPAGKLEQDETPFIAALREVKEETGLTLDPQKILTVGSLHVRFEDLDFIFHMFHTTLPKIPEIDNDPSAHIDWRWLSIDEAENLPKIIGGKEALNFLINFRNKLNLS
jgi:8-oxo-dGTP pyrophosphatase MutT (NUDIX family)